MLRRPDENKTPQSRERLIEATTKRDPNSTRFRSQNNPSKPAKNRQANPSAERILKIAYDITYVQVFRRFFLTMKAWKSRCGPPFIGTIAYDWRGGSRVAHSFAFGLALDIPFNILRNSGLRSIRPSLLGAYLLPRSLTTALITDALGAALGSLFFVLSKNLLRDQVRQGTSSSDAHSHLQFSSGSESQTNTPTVHLSFCNFVGTPSSRKNRFYAE